MAFEVMAFNPFRKGLSRARFQGNMHCPYCSKHVDPTTIPIGFESEKTKLRLKERLGPFIRVYKCMLCGGEFRYDIAQEGTHPYSSFKRGLMKIPGLKYSGSVPLLSIKK